MLQLEQIVKKFQIGTVDESTVFDHFDFQVDQGEFVSVIGSNGSGKTTLLNLICGSLLPEEGRILFQGEDITKSKEHKRAKIIGRVFQDPKMGTCANMTILENMALASHKNHPFGLGKCVSKRKLDYYRTLLEECGLGLENRLNTAVGSLSGGQRQALALLIANMTKIDLLILDEHTAALDPKSSELIMELTDKFIKRSGMTALMVTHNLRFAVDYGSRLVMMDEGHCVIDIKGKAKEQACVDDLLDKFYEISIEKGN